MPGNRGDAPSIYEILHRYGVDRRLLLWWTLAVLLTLLLLHLWPVIGFAVATVLGVLLGITTCRTFERTQPKPDDGREGLPRDRFWHWIIVGLLLLLILANLVSPRARALAPVCLLGLFVLRLALTGYPSHPLLLPVCLLVVTAALGDAFGVEPRRMSYQVYVLVEMLLLAGEVVCAMQRKGRLPQWLLLLHLLALSIVFASFCGTVAFPNQLIDLSGLQAYLVIPISLPRGLHRFHPNAITGSIICLIPLLAVSATGRYWQRVRLRLTSRVLSLFTLVCVGVLFLFCESRGGWLAMTIVGGALVLIWRKRFKLSLALVALSTALLFVLLFGDVLTPLARMLGIERHPLIALGSLTIRQLHWALGLQIVAFNAPFGAGLYGYNNMAQSHFFDQHQQLCQTSWGERLWHVHNQYLQVAVELGPIGYIAYVALWATVAWAAWRVYSWAEDRPTQRLFLALAAGLLAQQIFWLTDVTSLASRFSIFSWILVGLIIGQYVRQLSKRSAQRQPED